MVLERQCCTKGDFVNNYRFVSVIKKMRPVLYIHLHRGGWEPHSPPKLLIHAALRLIFLLLLSL
jgi:hypothetical protein